MTQTTLLIDIDKCIRCHACEVACKVEHGLQFGPRPIRVLTIGPREIDGNLHLDFVPVLCLHCEEPYCARFCSTGAIYKTSEGSVLIDENKCTGCGSCTYGCPYGAMNFDQETKKAVKCDLCQHRLNAGLEPSCVQHCIGGALQSMSTNQVQDLTEGKHRAFIGKVCYASQKWKITIPSGLDFFIGLQKPSRR
jgi:Fe-S-cluster-containing dehydrogenase component